MSVQITLANILKQCKTHLKHIPVFSFTLLLVKLTKSVAILIQVAADVCLYKQTNNCLRKVIPLTRLVCGSIIIPGFQDIKTLNDTKNSE